MKVVRFFVQEAIYNGHLQSLGSINLVFVVAYFGYRIIISLPLLIALYFVFHFIFLFDRYTAASEDMATNPVRVKNILRYYEYIPYILVFYIFCVTVLLVRISHEMALFALVIMACGYAYPGFVKPLTKYIPLFKNIFVSFVYVLLSMLPVVLVGVRFVHPLLFFFSLYVFFISFLHQILLDIKDEEVDKQQSLRTLPVMVGKRKTIVIGNLLHTILSVVVVLGVLQLRLHIFFLAMTVVSVLLYTVISMLVYEENRLGYAISAGVFFIMFFSSWVLIQFI